MLGDFLISRRDAPGACLHISAATLAFLPCAEAQIGIGRHTQTAALIETAGNRSVALHSIHTITRTCVCVRVRVNALPGELLFDRFVEWLFSAIKRRRVTPRKSSVLPGIPSDRPRF